MVPHAAATHPVPDTVQLTAVLELPVTLAVNCCCPVVAIVAEPGETVTPIVAGNPIVTVALPDPVEPRSEVATTVTTSGVGAVEGAVYNPSAVISPHAIPLQPAPEMFQTTMSSAAPDAVNWV